MNEHIDKHRLHARLSRREGGPPVKPNLNANEWDAATKEVVSVTVDRPFKVVHLRVNGVSLFAEGTGDANTGFPVGVWEDGTPATPFVCYCVCKFLEEDAEAKSKAAAQAAKEAEALALANEYAAEAAALLKRVRNQDRK